MNQSSETILPMPGQDATLPIVDRARLSELGQMAAPAESRALLQELLAIYRNEVASHLAELAAAWQAGDALRARNEAHYLAGSSANLGLARLAAELHELETLARDGRMPAFMNFAATLKGRIEEACEAYEKAVADLTGASQV